MKFLLQLIALLLFFGCQTEQKKAETSPDKPRALFEPADGEVILFAGQELEAVGGLDEYNDGYMDHFDAPAGWTTYTNINPGEDSFGRIQDGLDGLYETADWGDSDYNASLQIADPDFKHMALAIGLQYVNHEERIAKGEHDKYIDQLGEFLLSLEERPVFLRLAYEFDGYAWNQYDLDSTKIAYRRIIDRLREMGVKNTAYVWQSTGWVSTPEHLEAWYPGDDYVDWLGVSFFSRWREIEMFEFARTKGKPVFIAEASPTISDFQVKFTGQTKETQMSNPEQAKEAWESWFVPLFNAINEYPDVIKAVSYINCHWDSHPMWINNPTFQKIDARIQLSPYVSEKWIEETSKPKYLKASPELFDYLYNGK